MNRILTVVVPGLIFISLTLASWLLPSRDFSDSERRKLAQRPALSLEVISDGSFMTGFEKYTLDQFPLRNQFRTLKAWVLLSPETIQNMHWIYPFIVYITVSLRSRFRRRHCIICPMMS